MFILIVVVSIIKGEDLVVLVIKVIKFISKIIEYIIKFGILIYNGICFEEYLIEL